MIKTLVLSLVTIAIIGVSKVFAAGEKWVSVSSTTLAPTSVSMGSSRIAYSAQVENLGTTDSTFAIDGSTFTAKAGKTVEIPFLPALKKSLTIQVLTVPTAGVEVRIFAGEQN